MTSQNYDNEIERSGEKKRVGRKPFERRVKKITVDLFEDQIERLKGEGAPISQELRTLLDSHCADRQEGE